MRRNTSDRVLGNTVNIFMVIVAITTFYPLWYTLINSLNTGEDIMYNGFITIFPRVWTFANYVATFSEKTLLSAFYITVIRTITGTVTCVFFTAMVSYPLSKKYLRFRKLYIRIGVITMYFYGGLIPTYILYKYLGLINHFTVFIIPALFNFFNAILFINFFREIPDALDESAKIDGANDMSIFLRIVLPLSTPILATISLFTGVGQWNAWFDSAYFVSNPQLATLQCVLFKIITQQEGIQMIQKFTQNARQNSFTVETLEYATMIVSILPIILSYPFLQRYFIKGITLGSVKG